ncbi:esterase/lipase family protein [Vibrio hippocampi]|uniref:DUF676 domain-containing protein n=1 Tax=Vibrio hippocampi TaxID=654686 RepID=A0ABN8DM74_9VIBR|nr:putative lipase [Vibrio hippocampi]CAH0529151.1 hypothetical protein VHP8226_03076 [Vibrio hippocampi]
MYKLPCWRLAVMAVLGLVSVTALAQETIVVQDKAITQCDASDSLASIEPNQPLVLIVHGCFASAQQFKALAGVYEHLGVQTACFEYDDRRGLDAVANELVQSINRLSPILDEQRLTVIAHSQGGLIARKAHAQVADRAENIDHNNIELVTISSPFNGIEASSHCGIGWLRVASLGIVDGICYLVTGAKYLDIPPQADFINQPEPLITQLQRHLLIKTDETETCRTRNSQGQCVKDDYVFSLQEQTQSKVDDSQVSTPLVVHAGHAEIVGSESVVPWKLIEVLQQQKVMPEPKEGERATFTSMVEAIYLNYPLG